MRYALVENQVVRVPEEPRGPWLLHELHTELSKRGAARREFGKQDVSGEQVLTLRFVDEQDWPLPLELSDMLRRLRERGWDRAFNYKPRPLAGLVYKDGEVKREAIRCRVVLVSEGLLAWEVEKLFASAAEVHAFWGALADENALLLDAEAYPELFTTNYPRRG